ncbi:MAG: Tat pathway signal sequence domain protein [Rhodospirillales bacterium]
MKEDERGIMIFSLPAIRAFLAVLVLLAASTAARADGAINLELNKVEPAGQGCRIYMVFNNQTATAIGSFKPDLVFFDKDGVIAERLVVEGGPLAAGKTRVKLFDVANLACGEIARVLLNDIRACEGRDTAECLSLTNTASRASVEFIK